MIARRRGPGFTLVELAITLSISALTIPAIYLFLRSTERTLFETAAQVQSAEAARSISEELRRDLTTMHWSNAETLALEGTGACGAVRYEIANGVAHRRADPECNGGDRAIARHVESLKRTPWGVEMVFAFHTRATEPYRVTILFAGGETP